MFYPQFKYRFPVLFGGGGNKIILPHELQRCEWIMPHGSTHLLLENRCNEFNYIKVKFEYTERGNNKAVFGQTKSPYLMIKDSISSLSAFADGGVDFNYNTNDVITIEFKHNGIYKDNALISFNNLPVNNSYRCPLFYRYNGTIANTSGSLIKIWFFITDVAELYPCYIKDNYTFIDNKGNEQPAGTIGMYDVKNNKFYKDEITINPHINYWEKGEDL